MMAIPARHRVAALLVGFCLSCSGCMQSRTSLFNLSDRGGRIPPSPVNVIDRDNPIESVDVLDSDELKLAAQQIRDTRRPPAPPERVYNILVLSGGGVYGAYSAGVLSGWTQTGKRPEFDVITGVSTGGLIAVVAFLGPDYDYLLPELYTTVTNKDIFTLRRPIRAIFSDSIADNSPMEKRLQRIVDSQLLARVAAEHAKGRRLYLGTTNLQTRRLVVWNMGAIASRGTPESAELFRDIMMASTAVPGFFPPKTITVDVDGEFYDEIHVDGGISRSLFFRPPFVPPEKREKFGPTSLYGSNLYVLVSGKLYANSDGVRPRSLAIAGSAITSLLYAQARGDIDRLFDYSLLTGLNFHLASIPESFPTPAQSLKFDPEEMGRLYRLGQEQVLGGALWADSPPALDRNEELRARTGTRLSRTPGSQGGQTSPSPDLPIPDRGIPVPPKPLAK